MTHNYLEIFDLDQTLFDTKAQVKIKHLDSDVPVYMDSHTYVQHQYDMSKYSYDFSEFRDPDFFVETSTPIELMRQWFLCHNSNRTVIVVTGRTSFIPDNQKVYQHIKKVMNPHFDFDFFTVGDSIDGKIVKDTSAAKALFLKNFLDNSKTFFNYFHIFDDNQKNIDAMVDEISKHPKYNSDKTNYIFTSLIEKNQDDGIYSSKTKHVHTYVANNGNL